MYKNTYKETNNIGTEGCAFLIKADWKNLTKINLCIFLSTQKITRSEQMDVVI